MNTQTAIKIVQIISRIEFKADSRKVVYIVRSSNGKSQYQTTLFNGKATGCTCPARKPCYHMAQVEEKEIVHNAPSEETINDMCDEYEAWKAANGLTGKLTREHYCAEFSIYG